MAVWPEWWRWELELTPHVRRRMTDRQFTEVDLRSMMHAAAGIRHAGDPGRWVVETCLDSELWNVVVEPDEVERLLVLVTAYPVDEP